MNVVPTRFLPVLFVYVFNRTTHELDNLMEVLKEVNSERVAIQSEIVREVEDLVQKCLPGLILEVSLLMFSATTCPRSARFVFLILRKGLNMFGSTSPVSSF